MYVGDRLPCGGRLWAAVLASKPASAAHERPAAPAGGQAEPLRARHECGWRESPESSDILLKDKQPDSHDGLAAGQVAGCSCKP